jgi:di/tricarboxylate transporter
MEIWIVTAILIATLALLISEKFPVDLTAIGIVVALAATGILNPAEAVQGFANPAVITVAAMFAVSRAMIRTGAVGFIGEKVLSTSKGNPALAQILILLIVAIASAFINNTPVVVLFIPVILTLSCELGTSPSQMLIPISYASILAGTSTLIGTSTNIIVSDLSAMYGYGELTMFELAPLGVPIAVIGILMIYLLGPRLLPNQHRPVCELANAGNRLYLAELSIPRGSALVDQDPAIAMEENYPSVRVSELIRYTHIFYPGRDDIRIAADDLLLVKGTATDLVAILQDEIAELSPPGKHLDFGLSENGALIVELIITPQSSLRGARLVDTRLIKDPRIQVIAIERSGLHYTEQTLQDIRMRLGDIILVRCSEERLDEMRGDPDFIIVENVHHEIVYERKAPLATAIFAGMVLAATTGLADIMVCAITAVFLMILSGCLQLRDVYRAMQGGVLLLIAGTIALGMAMDKTGTSRLYAETFIGLFEGMDIRLILAAFILLTSFSTQVLSNNATAVLLLPIAISTGLGLGVNPKPFIMAVCFGASACFATPIGYQTNLLVYGPGGYRFSDYLKLGIPLNILVLLMGSIFIPMFWPF